MNMEFRPMVPARRVCQEVVAACFEPPPPFDIEAWAESNVEFGAESPLPGKYDRGMWPYWSPVFKALSPEDPCHEVVLCKSAQLGGTVVAQIFVAASLALDPCDLLYYHPTEPAAEVWSKTKWKRMARRVDALRKVMSFEGSRDAISSTLYQERFDGRGSLSIAGANSPIATSGRSARKQVQDDLSKWEVNPEGDPETQADGRSSAFRNRKIFKIGTPTRWPGCRTTRAYRASTQGYFEVPCPHCDHFQELIWENLAASIDPENPAAAHFTCVACGAAIEHGDKIAMVARMRYAERNPGAWRRGFFVWTAYSRLKSWADIARAWLDAKGDAAKEQAFFNDWLGRAYEIAGESPPWEELRDRANASPYRYGFIPVGGLLLVAGCDVQGDRVEVHVKAFGENLRRWTVEYLVISGHISTEETRAALDNILRRTWPDEFGNKRTIDMLAIDANYSKNEVFDWAKRWPQERVICVRGVKGENAPEIAVVKKERDPRTGEVVRYRRRFWNIGVSGMKAAFYKYLRLTDPAKRGFCGYPPGFEDPDEFFRQICAEKRQPVKTRAGYEEWRWVKDPNQANEALDTEMYAEACAIRLGWKRLQPEQWAALAERLEREAPALQPELFDQAAPAQIAGTATQAAKDIANGVRRQRGMRGQARI